MTRSIDIAVLGNPGPQGSKRYVGKRTKGPRAGQAIMIEMSKKVKPWREAIEAASAEVLPEDWVPLDGPLGLRATFWMPRPASHSKRIMTYPTSAPDLSKLIRSTEDALTKAKVWHDDARVISLTVREYYALPDELPLLRELHPWAWRESGAQLHVYEVAM